MNNVNIFQDLQSRLEQQRDFVDIAQETLRTETQKQIGAINPQQQSRLNDIQALYREIIGRAVENLSEQQINNNDLLRRIDEFKASSATAEAFTAIIPHLKSHETKIKDVTDRWKAIEQEIRQCQNQMVSIGIKDHLFVQLPQAASF